MRVFYEISRIHYTQQRNSKSCSLNACCETVGYRTFDTPYRLMKFYRRDAQNVRKIRGATRREFNIP